MICRICLLFAFSALLTACPTGPTEPSGPAKGEEGGPCGPDGECFGDLTCLSDVCVDSGGSGHEKTDAGSAACDACPAGTTLNEADCSCADIDECETDNGGCDANATCENAAASGDAPTCTCKEDYFGDGSTCTAWTECTSDEYESAAPTATTDRACTALTVCTAEEYESTEATATSDRACTALTTCTTEEYESTEATATCDRACSTTTLCGDNEVEVTAPSST